MSELRGNIARTQKVQVDTASFSLNNKYRYQVLILDITEKDEDYPANHAIDSLYSLGWCRFDDVKDFMGLDVAEELVKFCTDRLRQEDQS